MPNIKLTFARNYKPGSLAIRLFCWSRWSHVAIVIDGKNVLEATAAKGVVVTPLPEFKSRYSKVEFATIPVTDINQALSLGRQQIGKKYDWLALIGIAFRLGWGRGNKWFCSELVAHCSGMYRQDRVGRVTPEHIWMISRRA